MQASAEKNLQAMKMQSEGLHKEYDRLSEDHAQLTVRREICFYVCVFSLGKGIPSLLSIRVKSQIITKLWLDFCIIFTMI